MAAVVQPVSEGKHIQELYKRIIHLMTF